MKKILSLLALMMLCVTGANAEKVIYSWPSDASQANSITLAEGVTVAITGNTSKNIQSANKITVNGTEYTSMKVSNGAQNTLTLPKEAIGITFYSYVNKDAATDRAPYWKEVAGVEYTEETSGGTMTSYKDGANPDVRSFSFKATKEITFTNTGEQLCYVMEVEYAEEVEPVSTTKTIGLVPGPWVADNATFAAYVRDGEGNAWFPFVEVSGAYATQIPATYTGIILVRMKPATAEDFSAENYGMNWANVWNQTDDIDFTAIADGTIFTITGWGEGENAKSTYTAGTDLDIAKAEFQAAIDEVSAYNLAGLADAIAAAQAAVDAEDATIGSLQTAAATFEATVKAYVKGYLQKAVPMVESLNAADLATSIAAAKTALGNEDATAKDLATALFGLLTNARPYIITIMGQTVEVCNLLGIETTAAQALLDKGDEASTIDLANALLGLTESAVPAAKEVLNTLKAYMTTFSSAAAVALKDDFATLEQDINNGNIAAVKADIVTLMTKAAPYLKTDIEKLEVYATVINNEAITADVAAMKAAVEEGKFAELLAAVKMFETDFLTAAPNFVSTIKSAVVAYKEAGKTNGIEELEAAVTAAETALGAEDRTIVTVGLAIRNLVLAFKAYTEGYTTYTVAGTINLTATENAWDIVADNNMTLDTESGLYTWTAENVTVTADAQPEFKVVITDIDGKQTWIPASDAEGDHNWVITPEYLGGEGEYNITITFNPATQEIGVTGENTKPAQIIPNGTYYVLNAAYDEPQLLMAAGHNWGTKGIVNEKGLDFTFTYNESNNTYDIDSRVSNGGNNHFLSSGLWMDGPSYGWTIEGEFVYTISGTFDGVKKYIAVDENNELILTEDGTADNAQWAFLMKDYWENDVIKAEGLEAMKAATVDAPADATFLIKSPDFNRNDLRNAENWTIEASNKNLAGGGEGGNGCAESYHSTFTLSQLLADAPAGVYSLTAQGFYRQDGSDNDNLPYFYANDEKQTFPLRTGTENGMDTAGNSFAQGNYTIEPIYVEVTEAGQLTVGAKLETNTALWCIWDNFVLTYYGAEASIDQVKNAAVFAQLEELKAQLSQMIFSEEIEVESVVTELQNVLNNASGEITSVEQAKSVIAGLQDAIAKGETYIKAKNVLAQMKKLTESTNVYTEEAYNEYYGQWYQKYEAAELTAAEANALQDPYVVTGWRASVTCDNFLLSAWDTKPDFQDAAYYINTWSVEGGSDGTNFVVPFFEYYTGANAALGEKTLTATMTNQAPGEYEVSAWVRVATLENADKTDGYGISMQVNDGEAVNVCNGETKVNGANTNQRIHGIFTAKGTVGEDGNLYIKFIVSADNNIHWLSFQNVKYEAEGATGISSIAAESTAADGIYTLSGQKVMKAQKGLYIVNGKKVVVK